MTQNEEVLEYLKTHKTITQLEAFRELGIMRLASRISDLRKSGEPIVRRIVEVRARNGRKAYVAEYSLREVSDEDS